MHTAKAEFNEAIKARLRSRQNIFVALVLAAFSLLYFAEVFIRASQKYFWYDELFTLYLCRLPTLGALLAALKSGADFNPPFFYLFTKGSAAIFGYGLIGMRLPEIIGFWTLCLCLFRFVQRRAGMIGGLIAMLFPMLTGAFYYAFEARPYGIVLGFFGLALVCWQRAIEGQHRRWPLVGFGFFLFAAFMTHCYALIAATPFAAAELVRTFQRKRVDLPVWAVLAGSGFVACLSYIPLLMAYRAVAGGSEFQSLFPPSIIQIPNFYLFLLGPCISIVVVAIALLAIDRMTAVHSAPPPIVRTPSLLPEIVLVVSFLALPVMGVIFSRLIGSAFFARYFLSTVIGVCALLGLAAGAKRTSSNWVAIIVASVIIYTASWHFSALMWHRLHGVDDALAEPSTYVSMNSGSRGPLTHYSTFLAEAGDSLPIAVLEPQDFLYLINYAPHLIPRLYLVRPSKDFFYRGFQIFRPWCPMKYNPETTYDAFLPKNADFLVFGASQLPELARLNARGGKIKSLTFPEGRFLAEVEFEKSGQNTQR